jgi:hypothetical protein
VEESNLTGRFASLLHQRSLLAIANPAASGNSVVTRDSIKALPLVVQHCGVWPGLLAFMVPPFEVALQRQVSFAARRQWLDDYPSIRRSPS